MSVYFIQEGTNGPIKIGTAEDPDARLSLMQTGNSKKLKILAVMRGGSEQEHSLHRQFLHLRIRGEWFTPEKDLKAFISNVQAETSKMPAYQCIHCRRKIQGDHLMTISEQWAATGFGRPPLHAIIHACNEKCAKKSGQFD